MELFIFIFIGVRYGKGTIIISYMTVPMIYSSSQYFTMTTLFYIFTTERGIIESGGGHR